MSLGPASNAAPRTLSDWLLGGLGVGGAAASAGFAAYMILVGPAPADPHGSGYFTVFAHFDRRPQFADLHPGQQRPDTGTPAPASHPAEAPQVASAEPAAVDFTPTGSVTAIPAQAEGREAWIDRAPALDDFVLRDVFDGKALVEGRHQLSVVSPGTRLEGAGEVLSIERHRDAWVVVTEDGVIDGTPRR